MTGSDINDVARIIDRANDNIAMATRAVNERFLRDAAWHLHKAADQFEQAHYAMARAERAEDQKRWAQEAQLKVPYGDFVVRPIGPLNIAGCPRDFVILGTVNGHG